MKIHKSHAAALALAGVLAVTAASPSFARDRTWVAAGAGFAAGAVVGAYAANANSRYYGPGYAYDPYGYGYEPGYTYAPGYAYAPAYRYAEPAPAYAYGYPYYNRDRRSTTVKSSDEE